MTLDRTKVVYFVSYYEWIDFVVFVFILLFVGHLLLSYLVPVKEMFIDHVLRETAIV